MTTTLARRATAEAVGTGFLAAIVVGSGIFAQRLSPDDLGLQLLENSIATGVGLAALILAFASVSGAHFNPAVTLASRLSGGIDNRSGAVYVLAQIAGGCIGVIVANLMFELDPVTLSTQDRGSAGVWLAEIVATFGLVVVIFALVRTGRSSMVAFAVGGYIAAAYWFTSSTSFANPAVTIARSLTDTFAGISPSSVPAFIVAQTIGALIAIGFALWMYPRVPAVDDMAYAND